MENFKMVAKTLFGFEEILAKELAQLGAQNIEAGINHLQTVNSGFTKNPAASAINFFPKNKKSHESYDFR